MSVEIAQANMLLAMPLRSEFMADLAASVSNDGEPESAARWLHAMAATAMGTKEIWTPYDTFCDDWHRIADAWPVMRRARDIIALGDPCPALARYIGERLPALWTRNFDRKWSAWSAPVTRALVLAERSHDLVAGWLTDRKPTGSKDPYAMRRAANEWIIAACFPQSPSGIAGERVL